MSNYTTQVRFICETEAGISESVGYNSIADVLDKSAMKVFSFNFPIFDENYRKALCIKILRHYYTREIGEETYGLWKLRLEARMNEIMPYYNQLYDSELLKFNPLHDIDITTQHLKHNNGDSETIGNATGNSDSVTRNRYSDTPQGGLVGVENDSYLTSAEKDTTNSTFDNKNTTNGNYKDTEDYIQTVTGKAQGGSFSKMLKEFRETFLNIDMMIINDLSDLFFNLY